MAKRTSRFAFTLLELLVVFVIILILVTVLKPVFTRGHDERDDHRCMSDEKHLLLGVIQYTQDYDGAFPLGHVATPNPLQRMSAEPEYHPLMELTEPYLKNYDVWHCQSDKSPLKVKVEGGKHTIEVSYAVNGWFEYGADYTQVANPAEKVYLLERGEGGSAHLHWWRTGRTGAKSPYPEWKEDFAKAMEQQIATERHDTRSNVACVDGHVRTVTFRDLWGTSRETNALWP